jgi:hypothetical protein
MIADENYMRQCIRGPDSQNSEGPIMPTFQGLVSDEQLNPLLVYIKSWGQSQPRQGAGNSVAAGTPQLERTQGQ